LLQSILRQVKNPHLPIAQQSLIDARIVRVSHSHYEADLADATVYPVTEDFYQKYRHSALEHIKRICGMA